MICPNHIRAPNFLRKTCLAFACALVAAPGCGSDGGASTPQVDSDLPGVYLVDRFQSSPECGELMDAEATSRLVLYSAVEQDSEQPILVGEFCGDIMDCKARAAQSSPVVNYTFLDGGDAEGWKGYGIADRGMAGDQCRVEVQVHTLTSPSGQAIRIDTTQVETIYEATIEGTVAQCTIRDAIQAITEDSPCTGLFLLDAAFEAAL